MSTGEDVPMVDGNSGESLADDMPTQRRIREVCAIIDENMRRLGAGSKATVTFDIATLSTNFSRLTVEHIPLSSASNEASVTLETPLQSLPIISIFGNTYSYWTATRLWRRGEDAGATVTLHTCRVEPEAVAISSDDPETLWERSSLDAPAQPRVIDVYTLDKFTLVGAMLEDPTAGINKAIRSARRLLPDLTGDDIIETV